MKKVMLESKKMKKEITKEMLYGKCLEYIDKVENADWSTDKSRLFDVFSNYIKLIEDK